MEQTVRQCNIRITARYTSNFFISHIYSYNNIYFSLVWCAFCAFHEDFRLDRSFDFCEKRRYSSFLCILFRTKYFFFVLQYSPFFFSFFSLVISLQTPPHAGRGAVVIAHYFAS